MSKKRAKYGNYCQIIKGELYAVVNLRQPSGNYRKKYKRVSNKTEAKQWALNELAKHRTGVTNNKELTFSQLADWYKDEFLHEPKIEKGLKVTGVKDFERLKNKLDRMKHFFGLQKVIKFSETDLYRWKRFREQSVSQATINRDFALLKTMFKRAAKFGKVEKIPNFEINIAAEIARDRILSFDEERRLLAACVDSEIIKTLSRTGNPYKMQISTKRAHLRPLLIIALDTAMRKNEILSLTWQDIDFQNNQIKIQAGNTKTQKARVIGMTDRVKNELSKLDKTNDRIFHLLSFRRAFMTACRRAGLEDLHFHDLRHTAITRMIRAGIYHLEVMKISGHQTIKTFMRYLNLQAEAIQSAAKTLNDFVAKQSDS